MQEITPPENHQPIPPKTARLFSGRRMFYVKHIALLGGVLLLLATLIHFNDGYDHIFTKFGTGIGVNFNYDSLTYTERLEVKLGFTAKYLRMLRERTPANAVILMPPDSVFFPKDSVSHFNRLIRNRPWVAYFIYPRKVVYQEEQDTLPLYKHITHVAVVDYWGYPEAAPMEGKKKRYTVLKR